MARGRLQLLPIVVVFALIQVAVGYPSVWGSSGCTGGRVWRSCGRPCIPTCDNPNPATCRLGCWPGCQCPSHIPLWDQGFCIAKHQCGGCHRGRVWSKCRGSPLCIATCKKQHVSCPKACVNGCKCPPSAPIWEGDHCITADKCPRV